MQITSNVVPFSSVVRQQPATVTNGAPITVLNVDTLLGAVQFTNCQLGSVFLVTVRIFSLKGATAGRNDFKVVPVPGNVVFTCVPPTYYEIEPNVPIGATPYKTFTILFRCTAVDFPVNEFDVYMASVGSNSTIAIGEVIISAIQLW